MEFQSRAANSQLVPKGPICVLGLQYSLPSRFVLRKIIIFIFTQQQRRWNFDGVSELGRKQSVSSVRVKKTDLCVGTPVLPSQLLCVEFPKCKSALHRGHRLCFWKQNGDLSGMFLLLENPRFTQHQVKWDLMEFQSRAANSQSVP